MYKRFFHERVSNFYIHPFENETFVLISDLKINGIIFLNRRPYHLHLKYFPFVVYFSLPFSTHYTDGSFTGLTLCQTKFIRRQHTHIVNKNARFETQCTCFCLVHNKRTSQYTHKVTNKSVFFNSNLL